MDEGILWLASFAAVSSGIAAFCAIQTWRSTAARSVRAVIQRVEQLEQAFPAWSVAMQNLAQAAESDKSHAAQERVEAADYNRRAGQRVARLSSQKAPEDAQVEPNSMTRAERLALVP